MTWPYNGRHGSKRWNSSSSSRTSSLPGGPHRHAGGWDGHHGGESGRTREQRRRRFVGLVGIFIGVAVAPPRR